MLPSISRRKTWFSSVFANRTSKYTEFFQIFGNRMQEAQASKKAGRGNRAWDPCFADTGSPKTTFSGTSSNCRAVRGGPPPPPPPNPYVFDVGRGGGLGGGYPLSFSKYSTRRTMSADKSHPKRGALKKDSLSTIETNSTKEVQGVVPQVRPSGWFLFGCLSMGGRSPQAQNWCCHFERFHHQTHQIH